MENLDQIKKAVLAGNVIFWKTLNYPVSVDKNNNWFVGNASLYWADNTTSDFNASDFFSSLNDMITTLIRLTSVSLVIAGGRRLDKRPYEAKTLIERI